MLFDQMNINIHIIQFIDFKKLEILNQEILSDHSSFRLSFFSSDLERMYSKDFSRRRYEEVSFKINSNVIFETKQTHNFQFDLHPSDNLDEVICSTFIKNE